MNSVEQKQKVLQSQTFPKKNSFKREFDFKMAFCIEQVSLEVLRLSTTLTFFQPRTFKPLSSSSSSSSLFWPV